MTNDTPTLQILSTIAVRKVLEAILPAFEKQYGAKVEISWGATLEQRDRILAISIAARPGEPVPDVSSVESFKTALVQSRAVAYSRRGASGVYFAGLLERLGIADQVNERAVVVPQGLTGPRLLTREADLAVQQTSELMQAEGINIFAKLPADVQQITMFSIAAFKDASQQNHTYHPPTKSEKSTVDVAIVTI